MSDSGLVVNNYTFTGVLVLEFVSEWKSFLSEAQYPSYTLAIDSDFNAALDAALETSIKGSTLFDYTSKYDEYEWETLQYGYESLLFKYSGVAPISVTGRPIDQITRNDPSLASMISEQDILKLLRVESVKSAVRANLTLDASSSEGMQLSSKTASGHNTTSDSNAAAQVGYYAAGGVAGMVALALL